MGRLFGTDGVRGVANVWPMTPEMAMRLGKTAVHLLKRKESKVRITIGKDTRISSNMLEGALLAGITSAGGDCLKLGVIPTPAVSHLTRALGCSAGIVISASHNPFSDNGIKFFGADGFKLSDELEDEITDLILSDKNDFGDPTGAELGRAIDIKDAKERYINLLKEEMGDIDLDGLKVVVDGANGAMSEIAVELFSSLGADVVPINCEPNGVNINLDCGALHPEVVGKDVVKNKADIGLSFDGDADRLMCVDEKGNVVDGDIMMSIFAKYLKKKGELGSGVVATVMSNLGLELALKAEGIPLRRTKVGDRYVVEEMVRTGSNIGGEQSGHIILLKHSTTGDGALTALQLLKIIVETGKTLSELCRGIEKFPQVHRNVRVREKPPLESIPEIQKVLDEKKKALGEKGRILVRYSGTEPVCRIMVEGVSHKEIKNVADEIEEVIERSIGA
jgi:phosphoglucosamine mutase